jgi:hypothetical protein
MSKKHLIVIVLFTMLAAACASPTEQVETPVVTKPPSSPYPAPQQVVSQPTATSVYPGPDTGSSNLETQEPVQMSESEYSPAPGDDNLNRSEVFLDLEASDILVMESAPVQVNVILRGSLPDPCHELRVVPSAPDGDNNINIEVYSLADPSKSCITVLEPFEATISLGSFQPGSYTIFVNGEKLGEFDA